MTCECDHNTTVCFGAAWLAALRWQADRLGYDVSLRIQKLSAWSSLEAAWAESNLDAALARTREPPRPLGEACACWRAPDDCPVLCQARADRLELERIADLLKRIVGE